MTTRTLAEIYLRQGHLREAYEIFRSLSEKDPSDREIQEKLRVLSEKLKTSPSSIEELSREERIHILKNWLATIQLRRKK